MLSGFIFADSCYYSFISHLQNQIVHSKPGFDVIIDASQAPMNLYEYRIFLSHIPLDGSQIFVHLIETELQDFFFHLK